MPRRETATSVTIDMKRHAITAVMSYYSVYASVNPAIIHSRTHTYRAQLGN